MKKQAIATLVLLMMAGVCYEYVNWAIRHPTADEQTSNLFGESTVDTINIQSEKKATTASRLGNSDVGVTLDKFPALLVSEVRGDPPEFARTYRAHLPRGITMTVKLKTFLGDRLDNSELDQADGKWVRFDVHEPADKILDREILPDVQKYCKEILQLDRQYVLSKPSQFTDTSGVVWQRTSF